MGRVYAASHTRIGRRFAVKILFGDLAVQDNMRARFAREAEAASRLEHPNVVSVVDFGETAGGQLFLVMEFLEGATLEQIIQKQGALPSHRVISLGRDIARGLRHAHARGLVHRDMKPDNVVVVADRDTEVPKIVDFGVAFVAAEPDARVTRAGMVVGTPAFMSPEQALGETVDQRADLYGFGMMLYHLLAGRGPFTGEAGEILRQVVTMPVPPIAELAPSADVEPQLEAIVMRLLSKHPQDRFQDAEEVLVALEGLRLDTGPTRRIPLNPAERTTLVTPAKTDEVRKGDPRPNLVAWAVAAGLLLTLAIALVAVLMAKDDPEARTPAAGPIEVEAIEPSPAPEPAPAPELVAPRRPVEARSSPVRRTSRAPEQTRAEPRRDTPEAVRERPAPAPRRARRAAEVPRRPETTARAPAPPPPPVKADAVMSPGQLTQRYSALGARIEALAREKGDGVAKPFRDRYLRLPLSAALRSEELRGAVAEALVKLDGEVGAAMSP